MVVLVERGAVHLGHDERGVDGVCLEHAVHGVQARLVARRFDLKPIVSVYRRRKPDDDAARRLAECKCRRSQLLHAAVYDQLFQRGRVRERHGADLGYFLGDGHAGGGTDVQHSHVAAVGRRLTRAQNVGR